MSTIFTRNRLIGLAVAALIFAADQFHASAAGHAIFAATSIPVVEALLSADRSLSEWRGNHE